MFADPGDLDGMRSSGPKPSLDDRTGVGGVQVDVPCSLAAGHDERFANQGEFGMQPGQRILSASSRYTTSKLPWSCFVRPWPVRS